MKQEQKESVHEEMEPALAHVIHALVMNRVWMPKLI